VLSHVHNSTRRSVDCARATCSWSPSSIGWRDPWSMQFALGTRSLRGEQVCRSSTQRWIRARQRAGSCLGMISAVAQFEREIMRERQREGIAKAAAEGKYKGRQPTARAKTDDVLALREKGVGATEIAKQLGIGRASVYRIIGDL
jgi:hypothetical protein